MAKKNTPIEEPEVDETATNGLEELNVEEAAPVHAPAEDGAEEPSVDEAPVQEVHPHQVGHATRAYRG